MRVFLVILFLLTAGLSMQAQRVDRTNFRAGINGGLVVGDFSEAYSFTLGVDLYHHWGLSREIDLGIATGFSNAFGETQEASGDDISVTTKFDNIQFVPLAGSLRIYPTDGFKFGADVGYALGINSGNEGGLFYRPSIGIDMNGGTKEFHVSYFAVNGDTTFSAVLAGFLILF